MIRILIIDDDEDILKILFKMFTSNGYETYSSNNAKDGLKLLSNDVIDLVITDILMPDFDGLELIRAIKHDFPDIKIIAMSGGGSDKEKFQEYLKFAQRLGANHTVSKPIELNQLLDLVKELEKA